MVGGGGIRGDKNPVNNDRICPVTGLCGGPDSGKYREIVVTGKLSNPVKCTGYGLFKKYRSYRIWPVDRICR